MCNGLETPQRDASLIAVEEIDDSLFHCLDVSQLAFPDHQDAPTGSFQPATIRLIPFLVSIELGAPVRHAACRHRSTVSAAVTVPEAPVNEDDLTATGKHEIRGARKRTDVESVSIAERVDQTPHDHLRRGVGAANGPHDFTTLFPRELVRHDSSSMIGGTSSRRLR